MPPVNGKPLNGLRIAITRERGRAQEMADALAALGAHPVICPMITFLPPQDWTQADEALAKLPTFSWIIFTSINGVMYFCSRAKERGIPMNDIKSHRIACVGEATAAELHKYGVTPDYIPEQQSSEELLAALSRMMKLAGQRLLLPRGDLASPLLRDGLRKQGATVVDPVVYRNTPDIEGGEVLRREVGEGRVDVVCFSSPSTAVNAIKALGDMARDWLKGLRTYSIGPMTSRALRDLGIEPTVEAEQHDMSGLIAAVVRGEVARD
ncbi:MAG: hypothetical protein BroJett014_23290 [Planctomycetota bacterium]|nr:hypothetical protein [Planctomycetota bacterium]GIK53356.1 MAG: hypothetical protein BroJett014_23290 [Planctomycetota bacterium]